MNTSGWQQDLLNTWLETQKVWWEQASQVLQIPTQTNFLATSNPTWSDQVDQWWKSAVGYTPPHLQDVLNRVLAMSHSYLELAEQVYHKTQSHSNSAPLEAWLTSMEQAFLTKWQQQKKTYASGGMGLAGSLLEGWQNLVNQLSGMPHLPRQWHGQAVNAQEWLAYWQKSLNLPAAQQPAQQATWQALVPLITNYQTALAAFIDAMAQQNLDALQGLRARLWQMAGEGRTIRHLRSLYDLWVDVSEESYAKFALSDQYQVVYGDLVNAHMALRKGFSEAVEQNMHVANLPVRADLDDIYRKQYELRRENRALRRQVNQLESRLTALEAKPKES